MNSLERLLRPRSVAVLGGAWADTVAEQCARLGFAGPIWRVHPGRAECYRSLAQLPAPPDAVFLGVNRELTIEMVAQLRAMGAGGAVCFASGFAETGTAEGRVHDRRLREAAGEMPILGPNCYGMVNFFDRVSLFPDQVPVRPCARGVCVISQSGTFGCNMLYAGRSLPLGYVLTIGNQTRVDAIDLMAAALDDPRVSAIGLYLESLPTLPSFRDIVERARARGVPVVVCKPGRSDAARRTALSHSGAMGSAEHYLDAFFERLGVPRVATVAEFIETMKLLHVHGRLPGKRLVMLGASGGDLALAADLAERCAIELPSIPHTSGVELRRLAYAPIAIANPLDFQTAIWHRPDAMQALFATAMRLDADVFAFLLDHPDPAEFDSTLFKAAAQAFIRAAQASGRPCLLLSVLAETTPKGLREEALAAGVAPMQGLAESLSAIAHAARRAGRPPRLDRRIDGRAILLGEHAAKARLATAGLPVPKGEIVAASDACQAARRIGYPVVLKSTAHAHKTEHGGVVLNLRDDTAIAAAAARFSGRVLVEAMIDDAVAEIMLGVDHDPEVGPVIIIAAGGIAAEWLDDKAFLLPPLDAGMVDAALAGLKIDRVLRGYRGRPAGDREALIQAVLTLDRWLATMTGRVVELDINPLLVRPKGVIVVDALIKMIETEEPS